MAEKFSLVFEKVETSGLLFFKSIYVRTWFLYDAQKEVQVFIMACYVRPFNIWVMFFFAAYFTGLYCIKAFLLINQISFLIAWYEIFASPAPTFKGFDNKLCFFIIFF